MTILYKLITFFTFISLVVAQQDGLLNDPYLAFRPPFVRSLPIQIMLTGIVLTLVAVLFIHLMFTAQYHWPLAPVNYVLQLSGVTTLLISLIATIHVVLSASLAESENWPYMLSYIAVNVPPSDLDLDTTRGGWTVAEKATWLVMNASTSGLIQITHIQFLTLLYPSKLEGRLIFALLGPLAVVAAVMQLLPISGSENVANVASAVRNVCNASLSLLFTIALFIWGLFVNRAQAWRTDGGTAVFGCAALSLAVVSTALNFLSVHKEEEYVWLPSLMWAVVLWQSFLGWWWWVGAGSGAGYSSGSSRSRDVDDEDYEAEEKIRREAKRDQRRRERTERARERGIRARKVWEGVAGAFSQSGGSSAAGASATGASVIVDDTHPRRRRRRGDVDDDADSRSVNSRRTSMTLTISRANTQTNTNTFGRRTETRTTEETSSGGSVTTSSLPRFLPAFVRWWYAALRREHNRAARIQAAERVERIREMEGDRGRDAEVDVQVVVGDNIRDTNVNSGGVPRPTQSPDVPGGWYTFGWRKRRADDVGLARGVGKHVAKKSNKGKGKEKERRHEVRRRKESVEMSETEGSGSVTASEAESGSASEAPSREPSRERMTKAQRPREREREKIQKRRAEERGEETEGVYEMEDYSGPSGSRSRSSVVQPNATASSSRQGISNTTNSNSRGRRQVHQPEEEEEDDMYTTSSTSHSETEPEIVHPPRNRNRDRSRERERDRERERERERQRDRQRRGDDVEDAERGRRDDDRDDDNGGGGRSLWWWGPLSRWRLQDSTTY
ncbi:hypothetical protein BJ165DRAFT_1403175 [Panaeolus papilionaceus]|nr:hypothetical protein BJ165DRAFT_1403175 [Panaeolus papilionaceus]